MVAHLLSNSLHHWLVRASLGCSAAIRCLRCIPCLRARNRVSLGGRDVRVVVSQVLGNRCCVVTLTDLVDQEVPDFIVDCLVRATDQPRNLGIDPILEQLLIEVDPDVGILGIELGRAGSHLLQ